MAHYLRLRPMRNSGVTLLEVMFAIGIIVIGLLGVAVVLPVAGKRVTDGAIADAADRLGRNAIRQFDVGHMRQPNAWTRFDTNGGSPPQQYRPFSPTVNEPAFCIDPLFIATHVQDAQALGTNVSTQTEYFPYYGPPPNNQSRMRRVSLRKLPGFMHNLGNPPAPNLQMGMGLAQARALFMADDDLNFNLPEDRTLAPVQDYGMLLDTNGNVIPATRRQYTGDFTWMATVAPVVTVGRYGGMYVNNPQNPPPGFQSEGTLTPLTDQFTLSVIVFYKRDQSMAVGYFDPDVEGADPERLVSVQFVDSAGTLIPGAGIGGGNMRFQTIARQPPADGNGNQAPNQHWRADLRVRSGNWVMLSAKVWPNGDFSLAPVSVFRWYRVATADEPQPNSVDPATDGYYVDVSLVGPDWTDVIQAQISAGVQPAALLTQATLVSDVVAVYEKTIRMETSGMWTDY